VPKAFLGLNILHDTSAAIVVDGELICAVEEERFNRDRHTAAFPVAAIEYCLDEAGVRKEDLSGVGLTFDYQKFHNSSDPFDQNLIAHDDLSPEGIEAIKRDNTDTWRNAMRQLVDYGYANARHFKHHLTHAACGFYLSGFPAANVMIMDGRGEDESTSLWWASGTRLEQLGSYPVAHSLGHLYTYVTSLCGLYQRSGILDRSGHLGAIGNEGKTMGLSAFGTGAIAFDRVVRFDGVRYRIDRKALREFDAMRAEPGAPNANSRELAYAVQKRLEEVYVFLARNLQERTHGRRFVLAGGVALNCNANGVLAASNFVDDVFVPPAAHDAGAAIGAAFLQWVEQSGSAPKVPQNQVYFGGNLEWHEIEEAVRASTVTNRAEVEDPARVAAAAVAAGHVVGWCQGQMEFGPRALGNRSILGDPRDTRIPDTINSKVKFRESWRPFAPSVLADEASHWFEPAIASPYMLLSVSVREGKRATVPAITHVDGSARVQTVTQEHNPLYHRLIEHFRELTGVPMVLNTSLNIKGEPIARTPEDAIRCFLHSDLDVLVLGHVAMWKDHVRIDVETPDSSGAMKGV
jgi:carbamoyltransferase